MKNSLELRKSNERLFWTRFWKIEKGKNKINKKYYRYFWNEDYCNQIRKYILKVLSDYNNPIILDAGCGSGKASIILGKQLRRVLLDSSDSALDYAKQLTKKFKSKNINYILGDIFSIPFDKKTFDFVWNIGVVEHYNKQEIVKILGEMIRTTKNGGKIGVGFPNPYSGPILKAKLLKCWLLRFIPGYRIGTENFYNETTFLNLINKAFKMEKRKLDSIEINTLGNPLPIETPPFLIKTIGRFIGKILPRSRFITIIICKIK